MRLRHRLPPQSRLMQSIPSWVDPGALLAMQFGPDRYWRKGGGLLPATSVLATTRSSSIVLPDSAGVFQALGNNMLPRTDRGLYVNGQATNKCLNFNANPVDSTGLTPTSGLTVTQPVDTAMIAAAGLQNVCTSGRVYRVIADNTTNTLTINGTVGNTNPHTLSGWLYVVSGSVQVVLVGQASLGTINATAGLVPFSFTGTPNATSRNMGFRTTANAEYYFILNQLEEGSIASPPVVVAGAAATLLASDIRGVQGVRPDTNPEPFPGWEAAGLDDAMAGKAVVNIDRLNASAARFIAGAGVDADNLWKLIFDTDNRFKLVVRKSGVDEVTLQTGAVASTGDKTIEWQAKPGDYGIDATGVTGDTDSDAETLPAGSTTLRVGSDFGALNPFNGWIKELQILKVTA